MSARRFCRPLHFINKQDAVQVIDFMLKDDGRKLTKIKLNGAPMTVQGSNRDALMPINHTVYPRNAQTSFLALDHRFGGLEDFWIDIAFRHVVELYHDRSDIPSHLRRGNTNPILHEHRVREGIKIGLKFRGRDLAWVHFHRSFTKACGRVSDDIKQFHNWPILAQKRDGVKVDLRVGREGFEGVKEGIFGGFWTEQRMNDAARSAIRPMFDGERSAELKERWL